MLLVSSCKTIDIRYEAKSSEVQKYCEAVFEDAGFVKTPKAGLAKCMYQNFSEKDNSKFREAYSATFLALVAAGVVIGLIGAVYKLVTPSPSPSAPPAKAGKGGKK